MANPIPIPFCFVVKNGLNSFARSSSRMPGPWSLTERRTDSASGWSMLTSISRTAGFRVYDRLHAIGDKIDEHLLHIDAIGLDG